jgi:hypothetical protein
VNFVGLISGTICLISLALPWWGVNGLSGLSAQWGLFSTVSQIDSELGTTVLTQAFVQVELLVVALVLATTVVAFVGSFQKSEGILFGGFGIALFTLSVYVVIAATAVTAFCKANTSCGISGPFGSTPLYSWGFQTGFYLFAVAAGLLLGALIFQRNFIASRPKVERSGNVPKGSKFCTNCGSALASTAKFCGECASPVSQEIS